MWLLDNATPFSVERAWVRDREGAELWVVVVKGTFGIDETGRQFLCPEQPPVNRVPVFEGAPEASGLIHECDLTLDKPKTDVVVQGAAIAPGGRPVTRINVRLKVANVDKSLLVLGDRTIKRSAFGLSLTDATPFTSIPLTWGRAFGGTDIQEGHPERSGWEARNPVGVGFAVDASRLDGQPAPNIEYPNQPYKGPRHCVPAGFGPIARHWEPRVRWAGTYDKRWQRTRKPLLPDDFDDRFHQCAPEDQQVDGGLIGGELVELLNLSAQSRLAFRIPRVVVAMTTRFYDGTEVEHRPRIHTLSLQPNERRFQLTWHSALPCHHRVNKLAITRVMVKRRVNRPAAEVAEGMWPVEAAA